MQVVFGIIDYYLEITKQRNMQLSLLMSLTMAIAAITVVKVHIACLQINRLWNNAEVMLVCNVTSRSRTLQINHG